MKYQSWRASVVCCLLLLIFELGSSGPRTLSLKQRHPNENEAKVCGTIRDVIPRDSGRFRRILIRNTNNQIVYSNDDARRMTARTKSKLDVLASLVVNEWEGVRVRVTQAWTDQVTSDKTSLHYEGRSVVLRTSDGDRSKLGRLAGLAIEAGFDWVEYTDRNYIRASVIPDVCQTSVDLVFVLDGSGSVGESNFNKVKDFVKRVIDFFNIGRDGTHVSVVTYETSTNIEFNLVRYFTKTELRNAVDDIEYRGLLTYTGEALIKVKEDVLTASAGMRNDAGIPKVLLLLTDGHSNGIKPLEPADELRKAGVSIFSIGVGSSVSLEELNDIASDPNDNYVFLLSSFNELASFVDSVSSVSCSEGSLIDSCKVAETSVESGSFKYFRTTFDTVTNDEISIEVRDVIGISHLYASSKSKNPGPLDSYSVSNEDNSSPKSVSVKLNDDVKTVYVAVQGQQDNNKFTLSFWDNLFQNSGSFQADVTEEQGAHDVKALKMVSRFKDLRYTISAGGDNYFAVRNGSNGAPIVSTTRKLDYEKNKQFSVVIEATDEKNICHKSRAVLLINVLDVNDNAPIFEKAKYQARVSEKAQKGTLVEKVVATDLDSGENGRITYSIKSSTGPGLFSINSDGDVTLQGSLNYETTESYTVVIMAEDNGVPKLSSTVELEIFVIDINEQPRISCVGSCVFTVSEGASPFTKFGKFSSTDPDTAQNCLLQYTMPEEAAKKFTVSSNGDFQTKAKLDREFNAQYVFFVTVTDCGSPQLSDSVRVTIIVSDVNDNSPQFPGSYNVDIKESESPGSRVVQVKATDNDEGLNAQIKYAIPPNTDFRIDEETGIITTAKKLDYETQKTYSFTVTARDQGPQGGNSGSTTVTVNVLDVNDNSPLFKGTPYVAVVNENVGRGTPVIDVNATDRDSGPGGEIKYSIISGNTGSGFAIDEDTGLITVNGQLDLETTPSYSLVVQAKDNGLPSRYSQTGVTINIEDTNDNNPIFQGLPYSVNIPEDFDESQPVIKVSATDADDGEFGKITYRIHSPQIAKDTFRVENDGNIFLKTSVDYEKRNSYIFTIVATDGGGKSASANVSVFVTDVNDNKPVFEKYPYTRSLLENLKDDYVVGKVIATDADSGQRGSVTYSIVQGNIGNPFTINADGEVTALVPLDREIREFYDLTIKATDGGSPPMSNTTQMKITVLDENDNTPAFEKNFFSFTITENNNVDAEVGTFGPATDKDAGLNGEIVYTILSGNIDNTFEYDGKTGKLIAKKVLDREAYQMYNLGIEARDKGTTPLSSSIVVQVIVGDENDNSPKFSKDPYNCEIDENSAAGSSVCFVSASDGDSGLNADVSYELTTPNSIFSVDKDNGEIKAKVTLDRETTPSYTFDIIAKDSGSPSKSATVTVNVKVLDKNDNEPKFDKPSYSFSISEAAQVTTVVGKVFADDEDEGLNGEVVYSIVAGNTGSAFKINATSGVIGVNSPLDREKIASYKLTVEAADRGSPSMSSNREVIITVTDINDNDPIFTGEPYQGSIAEDASVGSPVVQVTATDADDGVNSQIKYSIIGGTDRDHFKIDEDSGFINTATKLDYETKKSYLLTVQASDGGDPKRSNTAQVSITVVNTNDNAPKFEPGSPVVNVSEAVAIGTNVVQFNATDEDGNSLTFSITGGNTGNAFTIDQTSGVLTTNASLDRETVPLYNLTVTVTETVGRSGQSSSRDLTVIVTDENDNGPVFNPKSYPVTIIENTQPGHVVTVKATDADEGDNAKITFSIDKPSQTKFKIDPTTGNITTIVSLDHEESPRHVITVTAKDSGTPSLSSTATVIVTVTDLNDNNPNFSGDYNTTLRENTAKGGTVIRVQAIDPDSGDNGKIEYTITAGNDDGFFEIEPSDGVIIVAKPPDREQNPSFTLTITASNKIPVVSGAPSTKTTATVIITIEDVNDNTPIITNKETSVEIQENSPNDTLVFDVDATDEDVGVNSEIEYEIVGGNVDDVFKIDTGDGLITVKNDIDREVHESYTLRVRASDKGNPRLFSEKDFFVNVTDIDDNPPVFTSEPYEGSVSEAANVSTFVLQVKASDKDVGLNGKIKFSIVSGDDNKHFKIDKDTGDISTNAPLDFETIPSYTLVVRAEDTSHSIETNVKILLININDNSPVFKPAYYKKSVPENLGKASKILELSATDKDAFGGLTYTIDSGNIGSRFTLDPSSGELRVAGDLDRETTDFYNLTVRVTDGGNPALFDTGIVEIEITDINDNRPRFNKSREQVSVLENSRVGYPVIKVLAKDDDIGLNGMVRYEIISGGAGLFLLDENSGQLTVNGPIDREKVASFRLQIVAKDKGTTPLTSSPLVIDIEVLDANDNSPEFTKDNYTRGISEAISLGSIVEEVQAIDQDIGLNAEVVYSLLTGHDYFKIDNKTGVISTIVALDRETMPLISVNVFAKDLGTPSQNSTASLTVTVLDANDNAPKFDPNSLRANVTEEIPVQYVTTVVATDADEGVNAEIEYHLESIATQFLEINSTTGVVTTKARFDFEVQKNHTFKVIATDKGNPSLSTTGILFINVIDTDDNCPVFNPKEYNVTVQENVPLDYLIVTVNATDVDTVGEQSLEYGIREGNVENTFRVERYTGKIRPNFNRIVDRELASEFNMIVRAGNEFCGVNISADKDEFIERLLSKSIARVNIFLTDLNDNAPRFHKDKYRYVLNDVHATTLDPVNATDPDEGINSEFDFALHGVTRDGFKRTLTITATDKGTPQQTSNTTYEVIGNNCETMKFFVSPRGNVSVKTLCYFEKANMEGKDLVGERVTLDCRVAGNTKPDAYIWSKDGRQLSNSENGSYVIDSLRKSDIGVYSCKADSAAGNIVSKPITIYAREPAKIAVPPKTTWAQTGNSATLSCTASGDEPITYSWYKNDKKLQSNADFDFSKRVIVFKKLLRPDDGEYSCEVTNAYGSEKSKPALLHVYDPKAVVEMDIDVNNPRVQENCQFFNVSEVKESLSELLNGAVAVVDVDKPKDMCNITACSSDPCQNQGTCKLVGSSFKCECAHGWKGVFCEIDENECKEKTARCRNNGNCVNRKGSFSCNCSSSYEGKNCQFSKNICDGKCKAGETCYAKDNSLGYVCIANAKTITMTYQLDKGQIPFQDWMIYDVLKNIENIVYERDDNDGPKDVQGRRKRRDTKTTSKYDGCSVQVQSYEVKGSTVDLKIVLVCKTALNKTVVCDAMMAKGKIESCIGDDGKTITKPVTTTASPPPKRRVTVAFVARDKNNEDSPATDTIDVLNEKNIKEKLQKNGMTVTDIRPRSVPTKSESEGLSAGVIAGIIIAIILLLIISVVIIFVFVRTRRDKDRDFSIGGRAILGPNSQKHKPLARQDISLKEINDIEVRGMQNEMFSNREEKKRRDSDNEDGSFMVQIPKSISKTNIFEPDDDYMNELENAVWFHGSISRNKAEDILNSSDSDGSYLVRAGVDKGEFYISSKTTEDKKKFRHIAVNRHDDYYIAVCGPQSQAMKFTAFEELLKYLRTIPTRFEDNDSEFLLKDYIGNNEN